MTDDPNERNRLIDVYRGDGRSDGLLKLVLMQFPRRTRNHYLAEYGDLVRNGNWNDSEVESFESDDMSYHGDSVQEEHHILEEFVTNAERATRLLIALTQYSHLVQFMEALEGGPGTLAAFIHCTPTVRGRSRPLPLHRSSSWLTRRVLGALSQGMD